MSNIITTIDEVFTGICHDDCHADLLKVSAERDSEDGERSLLIEVGSIEFGETAEELFTGQLVSTANGIYLSPEAALTLAEHLVFHALPDDHDQQMLAMVRFTEQVSARRFAAASA